MIVSFLFDCVFSPLKDRYKGKNEKGSSIHSALCVHTGYFTYVTYPVRQEVLLSPFSREGNQGPKDEIICRKAQTE